MGLLGAALSGFGGGAKGYEAAMVRHDEANATAQQHQWELDKEKRIEEATVRAEGRSTVNNNNERQAKHNFDVDPNNVNQVAQAEIYKQKLKDAYGDSRHQAEMGYKADEYAATHPNNDLERDVLKGHANYYNQQASGRSEGISKQDELAIKTYENKKEELDKIKKNAIEYETWTPKQEIDNRAEFDKFTRLQESVLQRNGVVFESGNSSTSGGGKADPWSLTVGALEAGQPPEQSVQKPKGGLIESAKKKMSVDEFNARNAENKRKRDLPLKVRLGIISQQEYDAQQKARH
jgi:hypothetical protein